MFVSFLPYKTSPIQTQEEKKCASQAGASVVLQGRQVPSSAHGSLTSTILFLTQVKLLRDQLPTLIDSVFGGHEENILEGLKAIMTAVYEMDGQGLGLICVDLALNVRSFFEDVSLGFFG